LNKSKETEIALILQKNSTRNYEKLQETFNFIEIYGFQLDFQGYLFVPQIPALVGISPLQMISELDALSSIFKYL